MIDTHAHIYADEFNDDRDAIISRAREAGVSKILLPNIDASSVEGMHELQSTYPDYVYSMMGLHPCSVQDGYQTILAELEKLIDQRHIAIGEIGIDLYWDKSTKELQIEAFKTQCEWAIARGLPIVIHSRETIDLILDILEANYAGRIRGVFHCFTGDIQQAERIMALGMYVGLGGVLTFKNSDLKHVVPSIPLDRIILETDSPYLAPVPKRGKRNEPSYVKMVHEYLAELLQMDSDSLDEILESNSLRLFKI